MSPPSHRPNCHRRKKNPAGEGHDVRSRTFLENEYRCLKDRTYHHFGERIEPMNDEALYETCTVTRPHQFSTLFLFL